MCFVACLLVGLLACLRVSLRACLHGLLALLLVLVDYVGVYECSGWFLVVCVVDCVSVCCLFVHTCVHVGVCL